MNKEDEFSHLFRSRLEHTELDVKEHSWERLQQDLSLAARRKKIYFLRVGIAASVILFMAGVSAAFLMLSPEKEMKRAFSSVAKIPEANVYQDKIRETFAEAKITPQKRISGGQAILPSPTVAQAEQQNDSSYITFRVTFTIKQANRRQFYPVKNIYNKEQQILAAQTNPLSSFENEELSQSNKSTVKGKKNKYKRWSIGVAAGTSLPSASSEGVDYKLPLSIGMSVGYKPTERFAIESGVIYSHLKSSVDNLHYLGVPVRASYKIMDTPKTDLYVKTGLLAEKCVSGEAKSDPMQLSAMAGLELQYALNGSTALFVEPSVNYYFDNNGDVTTLRQKKDVSVNIMAGIKMNF